MGFDATLVVNTQSEVTWLPRHRIGKKVKYVSLLHRFESMLISPFAAVFDDSRLLIYSIAV